MKTILVLVSVVVFTALALGNYFNEVANQQAPSKATVTVSPEPCIQENSDTHPFIEITPEMIAKADQMYAEMIKERRAIEAFKAQHPILQKKSSQESDAKAFSRLAAENQRLYEQIQNSQ